jgi:hypothetical protein
MNYAIWKQRASKSGEASLPLKPPTPPPLSINILAKSRQAIFCRSFQPRPSYFRTYHTPLESVKFPASFVYSSNSKFMWSLLVIVAGLLPYSSAEEPQVCRWDDPYRTCDWPLPDISEVRKSSEYIALNLCHDCPITKWNDTGNSISSTVYPNTAMVITFPIAAHSLNLWVAETRFSLFTPSSS